MSANALAKVAAAQSARAEAERAAAKAEAALHRAMVNAHRAGMSYRVIAKAADMSHQRVAQVVAAWNEAHQAPASVRALVEKHQA